MRQLTQNVRWANGCGEMGKRKTKGQNKVRTAFLFPFFPRFVKAKVADDAVPAVELVSVGRSWLGCSRPVCVRWLFMWAKLNCSIITWPLEICILMAFPHLALLILNCVEWQLKKEEVEQAVSRRSTASGTICVKCWCRRLMMPRINLAHTYTHMRGRSGGDKPKTYTVIKLKEFIATWKSFRIETKYTLWVRQKASALSCFKTLSE